MKQFINEWKPALFNTTIYVLFVISLFYINWTSAIFLIIAGCICSVLGNAILLHRYYTHHQFTLNKYVEYSLLPFAILLGIGSPVMYATMHRQHHRVCDTPGDPHSPSQLGRWVVYSGLWEFYPVSYFRKLNAPIAKDLLKNPVQKFIHIHYYTIWITALFVCAVITTPVTAILLFSWIPVYQKVIENIVVNGICHPGPGILNWPQFGLLTGGESQQKLHHDDPAKVKYSDNWLIDPAWPIIKVIKNDATL
jgi:fatty-acid desaturase